MFLAGLGPVSRLMKRCASKCLLERPPRQAVSRNSNVAVAAWAGHRKILPPARSWPAGCSQDFTGTRARTALVADHNLADLDHRREVGVVRDIAHDLLAVLAHAGLEGLERVDEDVAHAHIGRGCPGRAAGKSLVN